MFVPFLWPFVAGGLAFMWARAEIVNAVNDDETPVERVGSKVIWALAIVAGVGVYAYVRRK